MIALTTEQLRQIQLAAHALPVETRAEFLELVAQQIRPRPIDIESVMPSMKHGDWNHGEMSQDQLGIFRPFHEYPPYRTAFENVYLCGASTHPGGSIGGACGYNAATAIALSRVNMNHGMRVCGR